jgi:membrane-bound ClpP family serine protease
MKKQLSAITILLVAVISYGLKFFIGGVLGSVFGILGTICLLIGLVNLFQKKKPLQ